MPVQNNRELFQERRLRLADGAAVPQEFFQRVSSLRASEISQTQITRDETRRRLVC